MGVHPVFVRVIHSNRPPVCRLPVSPCFPAIMSLSKEVDTAVEMERVSSSDLDAEKAHATEHAERLSELADPDAGKSPEERAAIDRKLMRKVDLWLIPWLCLLYLLSFLDRSNIGNARLAGMEEDLDMGGHDYNNALTIFFISYALAEPITNVLLKRLTPRVFFTGIILLWGLIMTLMGLVTNYSGLLACRWFLGLAEAGLFPGVNYYLSCWYKRSELGMRAAVFFSAAALAGSFGGLLAAAIAQMEGVGGKAGWAWIFIIEGLATMFVGCFCWWMVFDWPATARFLTEEDRLRLRRRLAADNQSSTAEEYDKRHVVAALKDWKCWGYAFIYMGNLCPPYAFRSRHTPWLRLARLQSVGLQTEPVSVAFATWSPPLLPRSDFACCWVLRTPKSSMQVHFWVQQEFTLPFQTPCRGPATTSRAFTNEVSSSASLSAGVISTELSAPTSTSRRRSQSTIRAMVPFLLTSSFACLEAPSSCIPCCERKTRGGLVASGTTCMLESRLMTSGWLVITGRTSSILYDWIYGGHTLTRPALNVA